MRGKCMLAWQNRLHANVNVMKWSIRLRSFPCSTQMWFQIEGKRKLKKISNSPRRQRDTYIRHNQIRVFFVLSYSLFIFGGDGVSVTKSPTTMALCSLMAGKSNHRHPGSFGKNGTGLQGDGHLQINDFRDTLGKSPALVPSIPSPMTHLQSLSRPVLLQTASSSRNGLPLPLLCLTLTSLTQYSTIAPAKCSPSAHPIPAR